MGKIHLILAQRKLEHNFIKEERKDRYNHTRTEILRLALKSPSRAPSLYNTTTKLLTMNR